MSDRRSEYEHKYDQHQWNKEREDVTADLRWTVEVAASLMSGQKKLVQKIDELVAENKRLRVDLETLRSRCANHIPIWNDEGHGLDTICAACEQMAQRAVLATPLEASDE